MPKPWRQPNKLATGVLNAQGRINSNDLGQTGNGGGNGGGTIFVKLDRKGIY